MYLFSVFLYSFDPKEVIDKLVEGDVNVFMAVPTVYAKLLEFIRKGTVILINLLILTKSNFISSRFSISFSRLLSIYFELKPCF